MRGGCAALALPSAGQNGPTPLAWTDERQAPAIRHVRLRLKARTPPPDDAGRPAVFPLNICPWLPATSYCQRRNHAARPCHTVSVKHRRPPCFILLLTGTNRMRRNSVSRLSDVFEAQRPRYALLGHNEEKTTLSSRTVTNTGPACRQIGRHPATGRQWSCFRGRSSGYGR